MASLRESNLLAAREAPYVLTLQRPRLGKTNCAFFIMIGAYYSTRSPICILCGETKYQTNLHPDLYVAGRDLRTW